MSRWRLLVITCLITLPFLVWAFLGSFYLWKQGLAFVVWWPMAACFILGYVLAWHWQRKQQLLRPPRISAPLHWTERDRQAWGLVQKRAALSATLDPDRASEVQFYVDTAQTMALELARFYYPNSPDPFASLTIPEILAVAELVCQDLAELVDRYVPAGHLLTIRDWRRAKQVSDWYQTASNVYWLVSALFSPLTTGARYAASKVGMSKPLELLQKNLIAWFYVAFVQELGSYLIELYSGRLRVGAGRYRDLMKAAQTARSAGVPAGPVPVPVRDSSIRGDSEDVRQVVLTVIGQVKAGKSSLINALLGEQRAATDVVPTTSQITRYDLHPRGIDAHLILFDTVGYGHTGPQADQLEATREAARQSDVVLLVVHASNPARQADEQMLRYLQNWFTEHPDIKAPPVLAVMTHIDLLSPALEWQPPYNWLQPQRRKEQQIHEAWSAVREQLGKYLVGVVPICTMPGQVYGVQEWLLPSLAELLDEAHAVALLRCIRAEANTDRVRKVLEQLLEAGAQLTRIMLESYLKQWRPVKQRPDAPRQ